jgi:tRNA G10  N-methylase Trm11
MIKSFCILGRQPALGIAELESIYGKDALQFINNDIAGLDIPASEINFDRLGGTIKLCTVIGEMSSLNWNEIEEELLSNLKKYIPQRDSGKLQFGISVYDLKVGLKQVQTTSLKLKQALKSAGRSVRMVPNQALELNSAQVLHNRLAGDRGFELVLVRDAKRVVFGKTTAVQNITSYTYRDRGRPKRDARVGMLPPKLAQIIVNLANPKDHSRVLDPFCGTGVILQEAALMGLDVYGTDLESRMIDYSETNLKWLRGSLGRPRDWELEIGDATQHQWKPFEVVASEVYLGQPFSAFPAKDKLQNVIQTCDLITEKFLKNIHDQMQPGTRLSLALPAWQDPKNGAFHHLPLLDHLEVLGYNRMSFYHASNQELIYYRPGQIVGRELIIITRN